MIIRAVVVRMQGGKGGPPNDATLRRLVVSDAFLNGAFCCFIREGEAEVRAAGIALGIITIASWLVSLYGIVSARKISKTCTDGLMWFNWSVVGSSASSNASCRVHEPRRLHSYRHDRRRRSGLVLHADAASRLCRHLASSDAGDADLLAEHRQSSLSFHWQS